MLSFISEPDNVESTRNLRHLIRSLLLEVIEPEDFKKGMIVWRNIHDDKVSYRVEVIKVLESGNQIEFKVGTEKYVKPSTQFTTSPKYSAAFDEADVKAIDDFIQEFGARDLEGWEDTWLSEDDNNYAKQPLKHRVAMVTAWLQRDKKKFKGYDDSEKSWRKWYWKTKKEQGRHFGAKTAAKWIRKGTPTPKVAAEEPAAEEKPKGEKVAAGETAVEGGDLYGPWYISGDKTWEYARIHRPDRVKLADEKYRDGKKYSWFTRKQGSEEWIGLKIGGKTSKKLMKYDEEEKLRKTSTP